MSTSFPVRRLVAVLVAACLLTAAGCSTLEGTGDKGYITGDGLISQLPPADRGDPVEMEGPGLDGEEVSLADHRGTPVVVVVWGSWCAPCRAEAPELAELDSELGDEVQFVGINIRDASEANGLSFMRTFGITYPSVFSPTGAALLSFRGTLSPNSIPSTVVLDRQGRIASSIIGPLPSKGTLAGLVDDVVAERG